MITAAPLPRNLDAFRSQDDRSPDAPRKGPDASDHEMLNYSVRIAERFASMVREMRSDQAAHMSTHDGFLAIGTAGRGRPPRGRMLVAAIVTDEDVQHADETYARMLKVAVQYGRMVRGKSMRAYVRADYAAACLNRNGDHLRLSMTLQAGLWEVFASKGVDCHLGGFRAAWLDEDGYGQSENGRADGLTQNRYDSSATMGTRERHDKASHYYQRAAASVSERDILAQVGMVPFLP